MIANITVFLSGQKREPKKIVIWMTNPWNYILKLGMHTPIDSGSNIGWVSHGHTSFSYCVRLKC